MLVRRVMDRITADLRKHRVAWVGAVVRTVVVPQQQLQTAGDDPCRITFARGTVTS
jgi:hypothetical protein